MTMDQITVRPSHFRRRALAAFVRGAGRNSHGLNPLSAAAITFTLRYERLGKVKHARAVKRRVEMAQGVV